MVNAANLCSGDKKPKREKTDWFDDDCKKALAARNRAKIEKDRYKIEETKGFMKKKKKSKTNIRRKKTKHVERQLEAMENYHKNKEIRNYQKVKKARQTINNRTVYCKNKEGLL